MMDTPHYTLSQPRLIVRVRDRLARSDAVRVCSSGSGQHQSQKHQGGAVEEHHGCGDRVRCAWGVFARVPSVLGWNLFLAVETFFGVGESVIEAKYERGNVE